MAGNERSLLQFATFETRVEEGFWHNLSKLKLNKLGIDESPIPITGFYAPCSSFGSAEPFTLGGESISTGSTEQLSVEKEHGNRNRCPIPGILYNTNTLEGFHALNKGSLVKEIANKIWEDIHSGKAEEDSTVLSRFLLISFADLKKWRFHYQFAFPALALTPPATLVDLRPASQWLSKEEAESLKEACNKWRGSSATADVPFFLVSISSDSSTTIKQLKDWDSCQHEGNKILFGFYDPCNLKHNPGWPLRNFLAFICARRKLDKALFFCYRETRGFADLDSSLVGEAIVSVSEEWKDKQHMPDVVAGWDLNNGKRRPKSINLASNMDPTELSKSAADLNLKLMRWRALPSLDLTKLSETKCLLLGAGTLGCQVARMLMAWGVKHITLLDSGKVAMSNPLRQSLYTLDDCLNGGQLKAEAAVRSLKRIFPDVNAEGVVMAIPMPGHPVPSGQQNNVIEDCKRLHDLIDSHGVVFLLTDTRESRWLPSLLCANANKITINAALGFDSFMVMRHGAGPSNTNRDCEAEVVNTLSSEVGNVSLTDRDGEHRLGCYFCNDVVAPIDSTANRTLDQQCTVTRPGLAPIASSLAVELLVGILHHPDRTRAKAEFANSTSSESIDRPLGILPHQIRGSLSQFSQMTLVGHSSDSCTACSSTVVSEYRKRGMEFVLDAINHPTYLEDLTGLTELMRSASTYNLDWDNEEEGEVDNDELIEI